MPTYLKALVDLLFYLEKNFIVLPPEIACGASNGRSIFCTLCGCRFEQYESTANTSRHHEVPARLVERPFNGLANPSLTVGRYDSINRGETSPRE